LHPDVLGDVGGSASARALIQQPPTAPGAVTCPSCDTTLPPNTKICIDCGINVETGRSIVTSRRIDENVIYGNTEQILRFVSVIQPVGIIPVASEAMGSRKPYATWAIALLTIVVSFWFWFSSDSQMDHRKDLMLWAGDAPPNADLILTLYEWTDWGEESALHARIRQMESKEADNELPAREMEDLIVEAHSSLTPAQQVIGRFHSYQLLTHALLHGDIFHLVGNLLFLLIFGSRVSVLVGNIGVAILYPILALLAALVMMISVASEDPLPMMGASGAIMGLAGMYFVLFPVNRMHMAAWFRFFFYFRLKLWTLRGFWVVLVYVAFDVVYILLGAVTGVAHWAHLGGFIAGALLALTLLISQVLNAAGGDLVSVVLGRHAWKLIGRPVDAQRPGLRLPGV
jgi:membrane associated rhomboid family serine protease